MSDVSNERERLGRFQRALAHVRIGPDWEVKLVRLGFFASWALVAFMFVIPWLSIVFPKSAMEGLAWASRWIGFVYLALQYAEITARDPLSQSQTFQDHLYSLIPAVVGSVMWVLPWISPFRMDQEAWQILNFLLACAWLDFLGGLAITNKMFTVKYQRNERDQNSHG